MYLLEYSLEQAVQKTFAKDSEEIIDCCKKLSNHSQNFINDKFADREIYFLNLKSKIERKNKLKPVLQSFLGFLGNDSDDLSKGLDYPQNLEW